MEWENNRIQIKSPHLQHLRAEIKRQIGMFGFISFNHVYRELNEEAYALSKSVLLLASRTFFEEKCKGSHNPL